MKTFPCTLKHTWKGAVSLLFALSFIASAHAQIYVSTDGSNSVGEFNLDGTNVNGHLVGNNAPSALAISGNNLYVADTYDEEIAEYTTSGATVNTALITGLGFSGYPYYGLLVSDNILYVAGASSVGEYSLSGTPINASFIQGHFTDLAISGNDLFVLAGGVDNATVEEYDATTGNLINGSLITGLYDTFRFAVSGGYIYTGSYANGSVSKFTLSGAAVNSGLVTGLRDAGVADLAVLGNNLYIADVQTDSVGLYDATTGAAINPSLVSGVSNPDGILVVPEPSSWLLVSAGMLGLLFRYLVTRPLRVLRGRSTR